ncbi:MAG TPA: type I methionyl aminopeptidase [Candidatus Dojkabacteria bacterium]|nr:type I methionyl aminopeptidase [Candidatus Dojkabacteria bacterium]
MRDEVKIAKMRIAGKILSEVMEDIKPYLKVGVTLNEIDNVAEQACIKRNVLPAFKGYEGFPSTVCFELNDVVVHGVATDYALKDGDKIGIDMGVKYQDVYSDASFTVLIGNASKETKKFIETTKQALYAGIREAKVGNTVGDIGWAIQHTVEKEGYSVVREMVGHGIGYELHEEPYIPGYGEKGGDEELYDGQTIAIEAIINQGKKDIIISKKDGWTTRTKDGMLSALFEHTVVVGKIPEILTRW